MDNILKNISNNVPVADNEYMGTDGLLHCAVCKKATQTKVEIPLLKKSSIVRCICDCKRKELEAHKEQEQQEEMARQRRICFAETNMANWTFENDDRRSPKHSDAMRNYVADFKEYKRDGMGLLLLGPVGTGKTFYAACIANALLGKGYKVKMTNFASIANDLWSCDDKSEYMRALNRYSLLILDDLGIERSTGFMKEQIFSIVDGRYRSGLPMVVTSNLTWEQLTKTDDISYQRIFDRVLERCHPIKIDGASRRRQNVRETMKSMNERLGLN